MGASVFKRLIWSAGVVLAITLGACGGDDDGGGDAAKNLTDPRRVPTATLPAAIPSPIAALDVGGVRSNEPETYVVKAGDTLGAVAAQLGVSAEELSRANPGINPQSLRVGQELRVPRPTPTPAAGGVRGPVTPTTPAGSRTATTTTTTTAATGTRTATTPATSTTGGSTPAAATATRAATAAATAAAGNPSTYTVQSGDNACAIVKRFGISLTQLAQANGTTAAALGSLRVGQQLTIPASTGAAPGC